MRRLLASILLITSTGCLPLERHRPQRVQRSGATAPVAEAHRPLVDDELLLTLEFIEAGHLEQALERVTRLQELFPADPATALLARFLATRLPQPHTDTRQPKLLDVHDPVEARRALSRARSFLAANRIDLAITLLEHAHELNPLDAGIAEELLGALKRDGLDLYSQGRLREATTRWRRALELRPADRETRRFLERAEAVRDGID